MLEAPYLVLQAACALGEEASLASGTPRPSPPPQRGSHWQKLSSWGEQAKAACWVTPPIIMTSFSRAQVSSKRFTFSSTLKSRL